MKSAAIGMLVIRGDAKCLPLPDESVDLICTSPPYFALRSYTDGGEHYAGQLGSEATPAEYIAALVECTREWMRVLKPSGSMFINLGDKYSGAQAQNIGGANRAGDSARTWQQTDPRRTGIPNKSLMLLPERYRIACVDELGLIARAVICWSKPNGLPESVTDRVRRSHEDWVHLTKQPRYFAAVDEIREAHQPATSGRNPHGARGAHYRVGSDGLMTNGIGAHPTGVDGHLGFNPLGKLPGSVWEVATEPLKVPERLAVDHFAAFPSEWPRRLILGWSPNGVCTACGEGRRPVSTVEYERRQNDRPGTRTERNHDNNRNDAALPFGSSALRMTTITGYACACHEPTAATRPAVCVDPFGGTGTTAHVAAALGRIGISVDLSADYCRLAAAPELQHARRRKVLALDKPVLDAISEGQGSLLDMLSEGEPA